MRYVTGFLIDPGANVLLVEKRKPEWQQGRLNGIGGKVEPHEEPLEAMRREWKEETGEVRNDWREFCHLHDPGVNVWFFASRARFNLHQRFKNYSPNDVGERLVIVRADDIGHLYTIENLRWLIPLAFADSYTPHAKVTNEPKS